MKCQSRAGRACRRRVGDMKLNLEEIKLLANLLNELSPDILDGIGISEKDQIALDGLFKKWMFSYGLSQFMKLL